LNVDQFDLESAGSKKTELISLWKAISTAFVFFLLLVPQAPGRRQKRRSHFVDRVSPSVPQGVVVSGRPAATVGLTILALAAAPLSMFN